jgi:competence protein ComEC
VKLLALFAVLVIMFGCLQPEQPPDNATNQTPQNQTNASQNVTIIVGPQKNQTTDENVSQPVLPSNQTGPTYINDTNSSVGIYFINVGSEGLHGNAILVKKSDMEVLIDAGPAQNANLVVDFLNSKDIDDVDLLISTNADPRNYGGIATVADNFEVESFWWNGDAVNDPEYNALVRRMANASDAMAVERGTVATLNGMRFEVLNPPKMRFGDVNNDAIVIRLTDRNFSILLTSGIQTGAQQKLISEQGTKIKTQVLQAPYYGVGAGTSQIGIFLINAKPETVIITGSADESAANGGSRDPFRELMRQYNITWHENYVNGTLRVATDGNTYSVRPANTTG